MNHINQITIAAIACLAPFAHSAGPAIINFDDIPLGTNLVNSQFGWYEWGTGGGGQTVASSNTGSNASVGPGASSFVSNGVDSIHSVFMSSDFVLMEWDVELLGFGPSNNRGPEVEVGRDLDGDGILESGILTPPEAGYEGLFRIKINYDRIDIRYNQLDASGIAIATSNPVTESINFVTADTDLHCEIQIEQVNSHAMRFNLALFGQSGMAIEQTVVLDFIGPHRWTEINGIIIRTDNCCSKVDNISFSIPCSPNPADLDGNGLLNFFDISGFLLYFQLQDPIADFTGDGDFNFFDVSAFLNAFSSGCP